MNNNSLRLLPLMSILFLRRNGFAIGFVETWQKGQGSGYIWTDFMRRNGPQIDSWGNGKSRVAGKYLSPYYARGLEGHTSLSAINFNLLRSVSLKDAGLPYEAFSEVWRRERDSNPRCRSHGITVFKTAAIDHSAISPFFKIIISMYAQ